MITRLGAIRLCRAAHRTAAASILRPPAAQPLCALLQGCSCGWRALVPAPTPTRALCCASVSLSATAVFFCNSGFDMSNPRSALGERAQRLGEGDFPRAYDEPPPKRHGEQKWSVTITHRASGKSASSDVCKSTKVAKAQAAERLLALLEGGGGGGGGDGGAAPAPPAPAEGDAAAAGDAISALGMWSQARGQGNYREEFETIPPIPSGPPFELSLRHKLTGEEWPSGPGHQRKKDAEQAAARALLRRLRERDAEDAKIGVSCNEEALVGDKILALCLVLHMRDSGVTDRGVITKRVSDVLSNEALQRNAGMIGVEVAGVSTHKDASVVEQRAFHIFEDECGRDIRRTTAKLAPLFEV